MEMTNILMIGNRSTEKVDHSSDWNGDEMKKETNEN